MPTTYIDNTVDVRLTDTSDGTIDISTDLTLADATNIGARNLPAFVTLSDIASVEKDTIVEYFVTTTASGYEGAEDSLVEYRAHTTLSGLVDHLVQYFATTSGSLINFYKDNIVEFYTTTAGYGAQDNVVDYIAGQLYSFYKDIYTEYWTTWTTSGTLDYIVNYTKPRKYAFGIDRDIEYYVPGSTASGSVNNTVDITFTGWVLFDIPFDLYCGIPTSGTIGYEATTISGGVIGYYTDIFSTVSGTEFTDWDVYCCLVGLKDIDYEVTTISGSVDPINYDLWCTEFEKESVPFDVSLLSLKISNFSLGEGEYTAASGTICVDVTDDWYNVVTSGTYFEVSGTQVSGTFSAITDGYRMCYNPGDDFESFMGPTTFTVHAENDNNDILERDYYLTYGFKVGFDNFDNKFMDLGYDAEIVVRMAAENLASCPKGCADAYWFETRSPYFSDLGCVIRGSYLTDLPASIYPQSTAYFYGKTYRLVINAKDLAGNEMEEFVLVYTTQNN